MSRYRVTVDGRPYDVDIDDPHARPVTARLAGVEFSVDVEPVRPTEQSPSGPVAPGAQATQPVAQATQPVAPTPPPQTDSAVDGPNEMTAPIPGVVASIVVSPGQPVDRGDELLTLEAMKMLNVIRSPRHGTIDTIHVAVGARVAQGEPIVSFVPR